MTQVNEMLYAKGLFKWLDFSISGTTYERGGFIVIDYRAYGDAAVKMIDEIKEFKVQISRQSIETALQQVGAEEEYEVYVSDFKRLDKELRQLELVQWENIDGFKLIDTKGMRRRAHPVYLTHDKSSRPKIVKISLELDKKFASENRVAVAIFSTIARFILFSSSYRMAARTGSYNADMYSENEGYKMSVELHFVKNVSPPSAEYFAEELVASYQYIKEKEGLGRLSKDLASMSYFENAHQAPDFERTLNETGVLIGSEAWRSYANIDSILKTFENTEVSVRASRKTARARLI